MTNSQKHLESLLEEEYVNFFTIGKIKNALVNYTEEKKNYFFDQANNDLDNAFKIAILLRKISQFQK